MACAIEPCLARLMTTMAWPREYSVASSPISCFERRTAKRATLSASAMPSAGQPPGSLHCAGERHNSGAWASESNTSAVSPLDSLRLSCVCSSSASLTGKHVKLPLPHTLGLDAGSLQATGRELDGAAGINEAEAEAGAVLAGLPPNFFCKASSSAAISEISA